MKKLFHFTTALFLLITACPQISNAVVDTGRQYSSTKVKCKTEDLNLKLKRAHKLYQQAYQNLNCFEISQLRSTLKSIYFQIKNNPALAISPGAFLVALTTASTPGRVANTWHGKSKLTALSKLRSLSVFTRYKSDQPQKKKGHPKRREFRLFKGPNFK